MTSIGETLRRERLRRNLDLDQISRELKITPKLLEAIEAEEFDKLPGIVFAKSFVRQYAHLLGLDEDEMAAELQRTLQPPVDLPRFAETAKPLAAPIQVPKVEEWETVGDRGFSWGSPLPALALFVVAMLVCSGVYTLYQKTRHPVLAQNTSQPAPEVQAPVVPVPQPTAPQPQDASQPPQAADRQAQAAAAQTPGGQPQPAPVQPAAVAVPTPSTAAQNTSAPVAAPPLSASGQMPPGTVRVAVPSANPNATVRVQITAEEASWVLARGDGKFLFSGTLDLNQTRTVEGVRNVELRLGNAGGVSITLNGSPIGAVGPKGQVRTVQLTSGGFQIVAAPKSAPPIEPL